MTGGVIGSGPGITGGTSGSGSGDGPGVIGSIGGGSVPGPGAGGVGAIGGPSGGRMGGPPGGGTGGGSVGGTGGSPGGPVGGPVGSVDSWVEGVSGVGSVMSGPFLGSPRPYPFARADVDRPEPMVPAGGPLRSPGMVDVELSVERKVALLAGVDNWHTAGFDDPPVPVIRFTDGPAGARGTSWTGPRSASFPCGTALGATFDPELARRVGNALAGEATSKGAQVLLGPTVNLHRHPLAGRNFECMSEDPLLTATIATAYIAGVQAGGVACCVKHLVGNECEFERMTTSSDVDERTLRELYLVPFEAAVRDAGVNVVMTAYNRLNGTYCSEHAWLISKVLRGDWGFDGVVVSDWFGTHSTVEALRAGLDLEMPGPSRQRGPTLAAAVESGEVSETELDPAVGRLLALGRATAAGRVRGTEHTDDTPELRAVLRETASRAMVLVKNTGVLPIVQTGEVAVIGPNAVQPRIQGGGSAQVRPIRPVGLLDAFGTRGIAVRHEPGCDIDKLRPPLAGAFTVEVRGRDGAVHRSSSRRLAVLWQDPPGNGVDDLDFDATITGRFTPDVAGQWQLGLAGIGPLTASVDGQVIVETPSGDTGGTYFGMGGHERRATLELTAGRSYEIEVRSPFATPERLRAVRFGGRPAIAGDALERAAALASEVAVAVVVVGTDDDWETEGEDRDTLSLPGAQDALVEAVAAANPNTVVVVNAGSPVAMPWLDAVGAVVVSWFGGEEMANGIVDVLVGDTEPGGRLPVTFPRDVAHAPSRPADATKTGEPGAGFGRLAYDEGRCIGYRYADQRGHDPLFPFGFGLGYTTFTVDSAGVTGSLDTGLTVTASVTNTGERTGREVVQLYAQGQGDGADRPPRVLAGWAAVEVDPGESADVSIPVDQRALRTWTDSGWVLPTEPPRLWIGRSARDVVPV